VTGGRPRIGERALGAQRKVSGSLSRASLRRQLEAYITELGYSSVRVMGATPLKPEIARVSPVRGRIAYGETVLHSDLRRKQCHERLIFFSQRRTRQRSSILFFIGVAAADQQELEALLAKLDIQSATRGGHVHVVPIVAPESVAHVRTPREPTRG